MAIKTPARGRTTDNQLASRLEQITPRSHRKAQDTLVAAKNYLEGPRLFRSRKSLIVNLQSSIYELRDALTEDRYKPELAHSYPELLFSYLSEFSDAYPNWQREYEALNRFIPMCF